MITMRTLRQLKKSKTVYTLKYIKGYIISIDDINKEITFDGPSNVLITATQVASVANINAKNKYALSKILNEVLKNVVL